ncbi:MAG: transporter substrate-binding domain-containing protein [Desulfuromonadales bacterium]
MMKMIIGSLMLLLVLLAIPHKAIALDSPAKADSGQRLKTIIVDNYHPYTFMNDKGQPDGFSVEIARAVAKAMDLELEIRVDKWDVAVRELEAGRIDLLPMMAKSPERDKIFDFSVPHTIAYDAIFLKKGGTGLRTLKDLSGKTVIVMNKDIAHNYLLSSGLSKNMNLLPVDSLPDALKQLSAGKGDAAIMPKLVGIVTAKKLNLEDIETSSQLIDAYTRPFCFAVKDGNQALLERFNQGLNIIKSTGQYDAIYKKWFGTLEDPLLHLKTVIKYSSVFAFILLGSIAWNVLLKRKVKAKTEHLETEIIKRTLTEESLKNVTLRQNAILSAVPDIIMEVDANRVYTWGNSAGLEFFGDDVVGKEAAYYFVGEQDTYQITRPLFEGADGAIYVESWQRRKDGEVRLLAWWCKALVDAQGNVTGTLSSARDITESNQANEMLRNSEEKYRVLVKHLSSGVVVHAADTSIIFSNPMASTLLGLSKDQLRGREAMDPAWRFIHESGATLTFEEHPVNKVLSSGMPVSNQVLGIKRPDLPEPVWVQCYSYPVTSADGALLQVVVTFSDITERKQSEVQMLNMTNRLQLATSSARLGIWDWNVTENIMVWDDRMFELYGVTRDAFPNSIDAWMNGLHPEDKEAAIAECQAALKGEKEFDTEFRVLHPDGTVKHVRGKGLVVQGAGGTAERMLGINYDVTEARHAEEEKYKLESQLQQAQKMESVGRLAGGVAHDFNNMLGVILGHAELGLMHLDPTNPVCADLKEISKTAERSADLTRQLLTFARKQTVSPKVIDLNGTVTNMLKMLQRMIGEDINLTWQPSAEQCQVKMDPSQIDQILANLCVNARDAIEDTGRITIETGRCSIDADFCTSNPEATPGDYVRLVVSDNGRGMDRETQTHIFEPFYTTKEMGKGTGLGLATVYGAVKQNNGFINIYSEPGKGTSFSIHLPHYRGNSVRKQTEGDSQAVPRGQETILLVEDEAAILNITTIMLEKQGYTVLKADSPGRAMELAREHHGAIHLLMTDVIMPEMNGRDLARNILSLHPGMKRLFMSGYTADVIAHHGVLDDGVHFIQKPFSLPNMAAKVREVLDKP